MMKAFGLAMVIVTSQGTLTIEDSRAELYLGYQDGYFETLYLVERGQLDPQKLVPDRCSLRVSGSGVAPRASSTSISASLSIEVPCKTIVDILGTPLALSNTVPFRKVPGPDPNEKSENHGLFGLTVLPEGASTFERQMATAKHTVGFGEATAQAVTISLLDTENCLVAGEYTASRLPATYRDPDTDQLHQYHEDVTVSFESELHVKGALARGFGHLCVTD